MIALKVIATIFVALSVVTNLLKTIALVDSASRFDSTPSGRIATVVFFMFYGCIWRAFVIVALWVAI